MLKKLDEDTLIDAVGYGKMVQKLSVYNDKLYRDALTGLIIGDTMKMRLSM